MNVLFYIEPTIQGENLSFNLNQGETFINLYKTLSIAYPNILGKVLCSKNMAKNGLPTPCPNNLTVQTIKYKELQLHIKGCTNQISSFYKFNYCKGESSKYKELLLSKLDHFSPDLIFVFNTPAPFLKELFPKSLILHQEVGMFSRPPFPLTYYLDPYGQYDSSFIAKNSEQLKQLELSNEDRDKLIKLRDNYISEVFSAKDPFHDLKETLSQFKKSVLLPLQYFNFSDFEADTGFSSQLDLIISTLSHLDPSTALIVTQHPNYRVLKQDFIESLRNEFPNFIYQERFDNWYGCSQFILHHVDAVISIYSSIALQALFFGKKLFSFGQGGIAQMAQCTLVSQFQTELEKKTVDQLPAIHHLLSHYYIPKEKYEDPFFMKKYIDTLLTQNNYSNINFNLAGPVFECKSYSDFYIENMITKNVPSHIPEWDGIESLKTDPRYYDFYTKFKKLQKDFTIVGQHLQILELKLNRIEKSLIYKILKRCAYPVIKIKSYFKQN